MHNNTYFDNLFKLVKNQEREAFRQEFVKLHEKDQADFFELLYPDNKKKITDLLEPSEFAELFTFLSDESKEQALETMDSNYLNSAFQYVPDDVLADFMDELEHDQQQELQAVLPKHKAELVDNLLTSEDDSAASIMTSHFISFSIDNTVDQVIEKMRAMPESQEMVYYMYCVDKDNRLQGVVSLRDLIRNQGDTSVESIMNSHPVYANLDTDQEEVAKVISDYDLLALPVLDDNKVLRGIVTVDDIMDILEEEVTEDFHRFSGIMPEDDLIEGSIMTMTKQRLPWIVILIFLGLISARLIGYFEDTLAQIVALATFMPIILDSAGNVGTQSLAVAVRKLTLDQEKEGFGKKLAEEFITGIIMGLVCGVIIGILSYFMYGNMILGGIVGISLALTLGLSTVIGYIVPHVFHKLNIDPAVASGPFITTICDSFALIVYFGLSTYLIHYF